jgi:rubrerythrin
VIKFDSIEDILRFAVAKEEASYQFYMDVAHQVQSEMSSTIFEELAKEEMDHKAQLELEIMKRGQVVSTGKIGTEQNRMDVTLEGDSLKDLSYADALMIAIRKEKASFKLYVELMRIAENDDAFEAFMALAEEEVRHKLMFEAEYNNLTQKKN